MITIKNNLNKNNQRKFNIRSCPDTQAREGAQMPPSHLPHFPLAKKKKNKDKDECVCV
jgi:hypothetical protein